DADLLNADGERVGIIAESAFLPASGQISHYLVARSDPRLPGSSRWRLLPDRIVDQQPGLVSTAIHELDDLPLARASVRQDFLQRSKQWREQLQQFGDRAGERLEGWLEEPPWDEHPAASDAASSYPSAASSAVDPLDDWDDGDWPDEPQVERGRSVRKDPIDRNDWPDHEEDPWV
ncbi:MAG: RNA methyltransferase, partial [Synechococcus sp. cluster3_bin.96]|nr:RNA methyltransferase [Synechococcus sp. cluster3_bin.96]